MTLAVTEDHAALAESVRSVLAARGATADARSVLDSSEALPGYWPDAVEQGWLALHLPESVGGLGYGLAETTVVAYELGRVAASGPFLASAVVGDAFAQEPAAVAIVKAIGAGQAVAALALSPMDPLRLSDETLSGEAGPALTAHLADLVAVAVGDDLVLLDLKSPGVSLDDGTQVDPTRRAPRLSLHSVPVLVHAPGAAPRARATLARLAAAEAAGGAAACVESAVSYVQTREQFGRPVGSFQLVKAHAANMLCAAEKATALAWAAGVDQSLGTALTAAAGALPAYLDAARTNIQLHAGIGFTWEHDAHLHLRRAEQLAALCSPDEAAAALTELYQGGSAVELTLPDLSATADNAVRLRAREVAARCFGLDAVEQRAVLANTGLLVPHWPAPYGLNAGPSEQLAIDEELADVQKPDLGIGGWVLMTIAQVGTEDQAERWIRDGLLGTTRWCQLFSEPGAGSDAAAVRTRAERTDGGWLVTGQKTWTSDAQRCQYGLATVRTDRESSKHRGLTTMVIDLAAEGVTIRPIREITGDERFNEVFLDNVFVPDSDVVGDPGEGWSVARATLGNERVTIGEGYVGASGTALDLVPRSIAHPGYEREVGYLLTERIALRALNLRRVSRAVNGRPGGPEGAVTKLLGAEHTQRHSELSLRLAGPDALAGEDPTVALGAHFARCLTIAGGTSEILRVQIAERILGLPREPSLTKARA